MVLYLRLPFYWKNPIAYLIAIVLQMGIVTLSLGFVAPFMSLGIVAFLFSFSISKDLRRDIQSINEKAKIGHSQAVEKFYEAVHYTNLRRFGILYRHPTKIK